jgi:low affinity Fe/Cu permease
MEGSDLLPSVQRRSLPAHRRAVHPPGHQPSSSPFSRFAKWTAHATGQALACVLAAATIIVWLVTGPLFGFSDTWRLVINTGTTVVTFLTVLLIRK